MLSLEIIRKIREGHVRLLDGVSLDTLNKIPEGFNNNLIWHLAHVSITPEILCLKLSGLPTSVSDDFIDTYKKGTKPEGPVSQQTADEIKDKAIQTLNHLESQFKGIDIATIDYQVYPTSLGITLNNATEALQYMAMHEALHIGFSKALIKSLG